MRSNAWVAAVACQISLNPFDFDGSLGVWKWSGRPTPSSLHWSLLDKKCIFRVILLHFGLVYMLERQGRIELSGVYCIFGMDAHKLVEGVALAFYVTELQLVQLEQLGWRNVVSDTSVVNMFPENPTADDLLDLYAMARARRSNVLTNFLKKKSAAYAKQ